MTNLIYTVYKTTNLINNKIYIGVHKTSNPNDSYLGSGNAIKQAIHKYGKSNFTKTILFEYDNKIDMFNKEKELVDVSFIKQENTYNLIVGGIGKNKNEYNRFGYNNHFYNKHHTSKSKKTISKSQQGTNNNRFGIPISNLNKLMLKQSNSGKNGHRYSGNYITPFGLFESIPHDINFGLSYMSVISWCKNSDRIISKSSISKSKYLQSLNESPLGKTFKELGFDFIYCNN